MTAPPNDVSQQKNCTSRVTFFVHLVVFVGFLFAWFLVVRSFHSVYEQLNAADLAKWVTKSMMRPTLVLSVAAAVLVVDRLVLYAFDRSGKLPTLRTVWSSVVVFSPVGAIAISCVTLFFAPLLSLPGVTVDQYADFDVIAGTYKLLDSERGGQVRESTDPHDMLVIERKGRHEFISWTLDGSSSRGHLGLDLVSPSRLRVWRSDAEHFGQIQHGLYLLEEDRLMICLSPPNTPPHLLPTSFATPGTENVVLVYQRTGRSAVQQ